MFENGNRFSGCKIFRSLKGGNILERFLDKLSQEKVEPRSSFTENKFSMY